MKNLVLILILTLFNLNSFSQTAYFDIETRQNKAKYETLNLGKKGFIFARNCDQKTSKYHSEIIKSTLLDSNLNVVWNAQFTIPNNYQFEGYAIDSNNCNWVFAYKKNLFVVIQSIKNGTSIYKSTLLNKTPDFTDIALIDQNLYLSGSHTPSNGSRVLSALFFPLAFIPGIFPQNKGFIYNLSLESKNSLQKFVIKSNGFSDFIDLEPDHENKIIYAISKETRGKNKGISLITIKKNYQLQTNISKINKTIKLIDAKIVHNKNEENQFIVGLHTNSNQINQSGLFWNKIENGISLKQILLPFSEMNNFYNYLESDQKYRIEERKQRGKNTKYQGDFRISSLLNDSNGNSIATVEFFEPQFHNEARTIYVNGLPTTSFIQVFDGNKYSHAMIFIIDQNGQLIQSNCIPIQNLITKNINKKIITNFNKSQIIIAYCSAGKVYYHNINSTQNQETTYFYNKENQENYLTTQSKSYKELNIKPWINNYFIEYGIDGENDSIFERGNAKYFIRIKK